MLSPFIDSDFRFIFPLRLIIFRSLLLIRNELKIVDSFGASTYFRSSRSVNL